METPFSIHIKTKEGDFSYGHLIKERDGEGVEVTYLLFADDAFILCDARLQGGYSPNHLFRSSIGSPLQVL